VSCVQAQDDTGFPGSAVLIVKVEESWGSSQISASTEASSPETGLSSPSATVKSHKWVMPESWRLLTHL